MKRLLILITAVGLGQAAISQSALKAGDFSASLGGQAFSAYGNGGITELSNLFRNTDLFPKDLNTYSESGFFSISGSGMVSVSTSLYWKKKDQTDHSPDRALRLGLSFFGTYSAHQSYYKTDETPYDTVFSTGGQAYPVDSVYFKSVTFNSISQNLVLDASFIFRTNSSKRWTLYSGLGMQLGYTINPRAELSTFESSSIQLRDGGRLGDDQSTSEFKSYVRTIPNSVVASFYVPLGIDWQTGVKSEFFKQLHLFGELRPTLLFSRGLIEGTDVNPGVCGQFGVRIQFLNP